MYQIKTDMHVHSIFTNHAYSTIEENARYANSQGMEAIAITDHFGPLFLSDMKEGMFQIGNRVILPEEICGVRVLKGVEILLIMIRKARQIQKLQYKNEFYKAVS